MAFESSPVLDLSFNAAEDLSDYKYQFVAITSSNTVRLPDSETESMLGVLQNAPESGEGATVRILGVSKVVANAALTIGTFVKHEYVGAADAGKAKTANGYKDYTAGVCVQASSAEDDLCSVLLTPNAGIRDVLTTYLSKTTVTTDATADALTYTIAQLLGGIILRDPAGGARSDVTPTAALIVAGITGAKVGDSFEFTIRNTADAGETITVTAGVGVTLSGTMTIAQNNTKRFLAVLTNVTASSEAVTIYSLGTIVH